jgi:hypothetical protein
VKFFALLFALALAAAMLYQAAFISEVVSGIIYFSVFV